MATAASIAARKGLGLRRIEELAKTKGGRRAVARLAEVRKYSKGNEGAYVEALADALEVAFAGLKPDDEPLNLKGLPPGVEEKLVGAGIKTRHDARIASDAQMLSIDGIGPGTLRRIRAAI